MNPHPVTTHSLGFPFFSFEHHLQSLWHSQLCYVRFCSLPSYSRPRMGWIFSLELLIFPLNQAGCSQSNNSLPASQGERWIAPAMPLWGWGFFTHSALQPSCPLLSLNDYPFSARDLHLTENSSLNSTELKKPSSPTLQIMTSAKKSPLSSQEQNQPRKPQP